MAEKSTKKEPKKKKDVSPLGSGDEAEKKQYKNKNSKTKGFDDNIISDTKTAKKRGSAGGKKSVEARRAKKDAKESVRYLLELAAKDALDENLKKLGYETNERTNMAALQARLFTMAMSGNIDAYKELMKMAGYEPEENRKERESLSADRRREAELVAKVEALGGNAAANASAALNFNDEDENQDVVIYLPKMQDEKECEYTEDNKENTSPSKE